MAVKSYNKALKLDENYFQCLNNKKICEYYIKKAKEIYKIAKQHLKEKKYKEALKYFDGSLKINFK